MAEFRIAQASNRSLKVEDALGRFHRARAVAEMPAEGSLLHGPRLASGFAILSDPSTSQLFAVVFEVPNAGLDWEPA